MRFRQIQAALHRTGSDLQRTPSHPGGQTPLTPEVISPFESSAQWQTPMEPVGVDALVGLLWRRKLSLVGMTLLGICLGLVAALCTPPTYRARTSLQLVGLNQDSVLRDGPPAAPSVLNATPERYVQNQVKLLEGETLALRVAAKLGIGEPKPSWLEQRLDQLRKLAGLTPRRPMTLEDYRIYSMQKSMQVVTSLNSEVLEVFFKAPDPYTAARGADLIASEFAALNLEDRWQRVRDTTDWLGKQTAAIKAKLERASQAAQAYASASGLVFPGTGAQTLSAERMRQLEASLGKALTDRAEKEATYQAAQANPKAFTNVAVSGPSPQYETQLQSLRGQLAELRTIYTPTHPKVKGIEVQIAALEDAVAQQQKDTLNRLQSELVAARSFETQIARMHAQNLESLMSQSRHEIEYDLLKREVGATQELYDSMVRKVEEGGMAAALQATSVRVVDPARPPTAPYSPNLPLNLAFGMAFGLVGGVVLTVARERSDVLRKPGDSVGLDFPELGAIPSARHDRAFRPRRLRFGIAARDMPLELVTFNQERSLLSESFRATLTSILFSRWGKKPATSRLDDPEGQLLVVTSIEPEEGKTTVASNLAIALAETGRRVLLIDADLRRPRLHSVFNVCNDWGLADLLHASAMEDEVPLDALVRPTSIPRLWLVPSGPGVPTIPSLLHSDRLRRLLQRFRKEFDLVLIDSPPMALFPDARVLGRLSDGLVIVVRANRTSRKSLRTVQQRLIQDQIPVLGTILNDWTDEERSWRAYGGYYR
jgi:polysaccharide biosynthesis transport protein